MEETNYLGHTTLIHPTGEEVTVMLEEVIEPSSIDPVYFVTLHTENKTERTFNRSGKWFETQEEAEIEFHSRVFKLKDCGYVADTYID